MSEPSTMEGASSRAVTISEGMVPAGLQEAAERAGGFARAEKAPSTRRAYRTDFAIFQAWCGGHGLAALPALPGDSRSLPLGRS